MILVVVSEVHVGTNLNSAVTEVPTKQRRRGTVWHHRGGANGTTAASHMCLNWVRATAARVHAGSFQKWPCREDLEFCAEGEKQLP